MLFSTVHNPYLSDCPLIKMRQQHSSKSYITQTYLFLEMCYTSNSFQHHFLKDGLFHLNGPYFAAKSPQISFNIYISASVYVLEFIK